MRRVIAAGWHWGATAGAPLLQRMLERRVARGKEDAARLGERRGEETTKRPPGRLLWLHAASVGEAISVLPVLVCLERHDASLTVLFTTGTVTSARLLERRLPELGLRRVLHRFVPLDVPAWAARFLDHWRPDAAAFVESELWPNLLAACQARGIPMMLVNARMSAASLRRWRWAGGFARQVVGAFDRVHAQSCRLRQPPGAARRPRPAAPGQPEAGLADPAGRPGRSIPPRCPHRRAPALARDDDASGRGKRRRRRASPPASGASRLADDHRAPPSRARRGRLPPNWARPPRRSLGQDPPDGGIWIVDTLGEVGLLYTLAPIVFIGRSLIGRGGQNPLEAARFGAAIAAGPHMGNFVETTKLLRSADALAEVTDAVTLAAWVDRMLRDPAARDAMGQAARSVATGESALPDRIADALRELLHRVKAPNFWQRDGLVPALLSPAASLVAAATRRRVRRPGWRAPVPVLCCGNASVGGAGKTTVVLDLIHRLRRRGVAVHCLTRGYGGRVKGTCVARRSGPVTPAALVGDEPLLLAAAAPTWVGADRAASARAAVAAGAELLLMDDGLQNPGLEKTASLLIVDGAVGFGNGRVMPAGPLRETVAAAAARCRAGVLIGADTAGARSAVGDLPVLDAWLVPDRTLDGERVFAFCGIGRPGKFFETVTVAGADLAGSRSFPDHHMFYRRTRSGRSWRPRRSTGRGRSRRRRTPSVSRRMFGRMSRCWGYD